MATRFPKWFCWRLRALLVAVAFLAGPAHVALIAHVAADPERDGERTYEVRSVLEATAACSRTAGGRRVAADVDRSAPPPGRPAAMPRAPRRIAVVRARPAPAFRELRRDNGIGRNLLT
jgi:hypothetical protein